MWVCHCYGDVCGVVVVCVVGGGGLSWCGFGVLCRVGGVVRGVDEPAKCAYTATLVTPAACDGSAAKELQMELEHDGSHAEL